MWLSDSKRERYLKQVQAMAQDHPPAEPTIVFEGNVPADVTSNERLAELITEPAWAAPPAVSEAWLGQPVAIKGPTAALFSRRSGSNLMVVGQREETALALTATSLVSLAAQHKDASFWIFDGTADDGPQAGYLAQLAKTLNHDVRLVTWRDVAEALTRLSEILGSRQSTRDEGPPVFITIHGLQQFRELKRGDDLAFSFGDSDAAPSPAGQFGELLREGSSVGMHVLLWCDTATNLERAVDRQGLREFENRVLFQMSATDSTNLIDTPGASKLGLHRALFCHEARGVVEKFRPYALPTEEWLAQVREHLHGKRGSVLQS